jgi:proteic killer suppression protein
MIRTIRHKGLKRFFEQDDPGGVNPQHIGKLRNILATLHAAPYDCPYGYAGL